eukprot:s60_g34.t2
MLPMASACIGKCVEQASAKTAMPQQHWTRVNFCFQKIPASSDWMRRKVSAADPSMDVALGPRGDEEGSSEEQKCPGVSLDNLWVPGALVLGVVVGLLLPANQPGWGARTSEVLGWTYFFAWSVSFYPQVFLNIRRRSVVGLSLDYQILNAFGFACYFLFNALLFWSPGIRTAYRQSHHGQDSAVRLNDVVFAGHAFLITLITLAQIDETSTDQRAGLQFLQSRATERTYSLQLCLAQEWCVIAACCRLARPAIISDGYRQDEPFIPSSIQAYAAAQVARPRTAPNQAAAVPLPIHLGASAGSPGVYVPVQLVGGLQGTPSSAAGNLWTWVVAATGAAWHGARQSHEPRQPRPVRRSQNVVPNLNVGTHATEEEGWQTASEDEEETWQAPAPEAHLFQQPSFSNMFTNSIPEMMQFQQASHMPQMLHMPPGPHMPQMMPMVMVPVPLRAGASVDAVQETEAREARGRGVPAASPGPSGPSGPGPVSPGRLDRNVSSALSEASDWASVEQASLASSSSSVQRRWTNRDCDWALRQLTSSPSGPSRELLQQILQDAWALAGSKSGTRVVQAAMDVAEAPDKQLLTNVFKGRVWYALKSPHANHVLQKIIALMPPEKMQFVFEELRPNSISSLEWSC